MVSRTSTALWALLAAHAVSLLGNVVAAVGIPWFVLATTGSAARTGLAAFCTTVPLALGALFGGAVADRVGPKPTSVAGDLLSGAPLAAIPLLAAVGALEFWQVLALGFLGALFDGPSQAARQALIPDLAARAEMPLERANALYKGTEHIGYVLAAPLAGVLVAAVGAANALWLDAASFVVAALVVAVALPTARPAVRTHGPYAGELVEGLRFIVREPVVRALLLVPVVGNFFISPLAPVVLPVYAREELGGAGAFGALMAAYGAGGLVGIASFGVLGPHLTRMRVHVGLAFVYPAVSCALLPLPPLVPALVVLGLVGVTAGVATPLYQTVRQERTPPALRGRVFATVAAAEAAAIPPAVLLAGYVVETLGLRAALVLFPAGNAAYGALKLWIVRARDLDVVADDARGTVRPGARLRRHPLARRAVR
jgi:MFS family permease